MSMNNPYESPQAIPPVVAAPWGEKPAPQDAGVWRKNKILVMDKRATLPPVCIKSNLPADGGWLKRSLSWHHPLIALSIFAGLLIYVILAIVLSQKAVIHIALTQHWRRIRRRRILIGWLVVLAGVGLFVLGMMNTDRGNDLAWFMLIGFFVALIGLCYGAWASRLVAPQKIDHHYVYLKGAHPDSLARFPDWPYSY